VVSTKKLGETIRQKAVSKVVVKGTRVKSSSGNFTGSTAGAPTSYVKTFHGPATAYTGGGITASGAAARRGLVAVNPKQIPYGSRLYIVADDGTVYGNCIAADTGGFVTNGSGTLVDLYMDTQAQCVNWGRRNVTIYVLSWGNGRV
ncbi:MAG: 3D domain-containing protein, partial [Clostridia bacterium]|nr:3D domain-containing protein [Clostridia bacterium]